MRLLHLCIPFLLLLPAVSIAKSKYTSEDTSRINSALRNINAVIAQSRDSALTLVRNTYEESVKLGYEQGIADAGLLLGTNEMYLSRYDAALQHYQKSISYYKKNNQQEKLAEAYTVSGINEGMQNHSANALHWFLQAADIAKALKDKARLADIDYKIGLVYGQVNDFDNALLYEKRALTYAQQTGDSNLQINVYNNIGVLYGRMKVYDEALSALEKTRMLAAAKQTTHIIPEVFLNLGNVYSETGRYDSASYYLNRSLAIYEQVNFPMGIAGASSALAELLVKQNKYDEALDHIDVSMALAVSFDDKDLLLQNNLLLEKIYKAQGRYKESAMLFDTVMSLHKVVENAEKRALVEKTSMAFEMQHIADEIKRLEKEKNQKTLQRNIFIGFSIVTLILVAFAIAAVFEIRKKNKLVTRKKAALEESNRLKDKMFAIISHDLRSPLGSIITSLELFGSDVLDERERKMLISDLQLSASSTLEMLDNMLYWGADQFKKEGLHREAVDVAELATDTGKLLNSVAVHKSIQLEQKIDAICIARFDKNQLAFIMRNLVTNAIKFSHEGQKVALTGRKENDRIILEVRDEGVGMSEELCQKLFDLKEHISSKGTAGERGVGLGLVLIQEFLEKNNGTMRVTSEEGVGSCFELNIPAV